MFPSVDDGHFVGEYIPLSAKAKPYHLTFPGSHCPFLSFRLKSSGFLFLRFTFYFFLVFWFSHHVSLTWSVTCISIAIDSTSRDKELSFFIIHPHFIFLLFSTRTLVSIQDQMFLLIRLLYDVSSTNARSYPSKLNPTTGSYLIKYFVHDIKWLFISQIKVQSSMTINRDIIVHM